MVNKTLIWFYYWGRYIIRTKLTSIWKCVGFKYTKHNFLNAEETNLSIYKKIEQGKPFMACRIGANESFTMRTYEFRHFKNYEKALKQLCICAGFFPEKVEYASEFVNIMQEAARQADICGTLLCPLDDYFLDKYLNENANVTILDHIDPISKDNSWSRALKGKKVLIVHPFAKTIEKQYKKRENIYPRNDFLPEFELLVFKAVQTSAGQKDKRFASWFEALDYMSDEISKMEFDIALLGCGAYGMPLAARIKQMNKQAVQVGGSLQLLFGIKGRRWDNDPLVSSFYNEAWVYPEKSETPTGAGMVENACYWR